MILLRYFIKSSIRFSCTYMYCGVLVVSSYTSLRYGKKPHLKSFSQDEALGL